MSWAGVRVGIGTRVSYDGETYEVTDWIAAPTGTDVIMRGPRSVCRMCLVALLTGDRTRLIPDGPGPSPDDEDDPAAIVLGGLSVEEARGVRELAAHLREVLTGYRSGSEEIALEGEPRAGYGPRVPMESRYEAKGIELGKSARQVRRLVKAYRERGEAGLVPGRRRGERRVDERWAATASQVMLEHTNESKPSEAAIIYLTAKRLELEYGDGVVKEPSRATAYRILRELENRQPLFDRPTKRNRDIAGRPKRPYRKLRATRPGEYLILDTTPLDVFAFDPVTLRWVRVELTVAMDWYTRCVVALRLTPYSSKAVDAAAVLFQTFHPLPAGEHWPDYAVWPAHGIPREIIIDPEQFDRTGKPTATPALNPESLVIDHGKMYVAEHVSSVCQRMGISIQPVHVREGREKGPLERFFRTIREFLLQYLPGYKGSDINARGLNVEGHAFFYIDELQEVLRYWVATFYHHKEHDSLRDPDRPAVKMSPAKMFTHGITRAGYIEAPRDPQLAYEFLKVEPRKIRHNGVQRGNLMYGGAVLSELADRKSPYRGRFANRWPIHVDPDNVSHVFIKHPDTHEWHELKWQLADEYPMAFSDEGYQYARKLVLEKHGFVDTRMAMDALFTRFNLAMGLSVSERRKALRMARQDAALSNQVPQDDAAIAADAVEKTLGAARPAARRDGDAVLPPESGDDDDADDLDDSEFADTTGEFDEMRWS